MQYGVSMDMAGPRRKEYAVYSVRNIKHGAWKSIVYVFLEREYGNGCMDYGVCDAAYSMQYGMCNILSRVEYA